MRLTRLEDNKTLKPFDCGDDDLNGFLIGFGTRLVAGIKQMLLMQQSQSVCRFLTVDAYRAAVPFYVKGGVCDVDNIVEGTTVSRCWSTR